MSSAFTGTTTGNRTLCHIIKIKVMHHIEVCRTAELGGHLQQCDQCGFEQIAYNSCRDRHCPKCQCLVKEQWLNDRKAELLPCGYFHLVFTLPHDLNPIISCTKGSFCKYSLHLSVKHCRDLQKIHNGDLKVNSASFQCFTPGLRHLWTISTFTV